MVVEYRKGRKFVRLFTFGNHWRIETENSIIGYATLKYAKRDLKRIKETFWR